MSMEGCCVVECKHGARTKRARRICPIETMESFDQLLIEAEAAHGHLCAGQVLGVRLALLGLSRLGFNGRPQGPDRKRLITYVEIDRCATDAIALVTGCRLGKRALKFRDWGKMAATFVDLAANKAIRIVAVEESRKLADRLYSHLDNKTSRQMQAYRELPDSQLFREQWVRVAIDAADLPGHSGDRVICARCGEGVSFGRVAQVEGQTLCLSCAHPELRYWDAGPDD
jgi:formylmethanofuran dehydrogenase subunit E